MSSSAGDETPVNLTIVQASSKDSGVYGCSITNEYGTDSTDLLLSAESNDKKAPYILLLHSSHNLFFYLFSPCFAVLAGISLREDLGGKIRFWTLSF